MAGNTGRVIYRNLEEYDLSTGIATGNIKRNLESDPDYIPPFTNETMCPVGTISVSPSSMHFYYYGGTRTATVTATHPWTLGSGLMSVSPTSGVAGNTTITIDIFTTAESTPQEYQANFVLNNSNTTATLYISQDGNTGGQVPVEPI